MSGYTNNKLKGVAVVISVQFLIDFHVILSEIQALDVFHMHWVNS